MLLVCRRAVEASRRLPPGVNRACCKHTDSVNSTASTGEVDAGGDSALEQSIFVFRNLVPVTVDVAVTSVHPGFVEAHIVVRKTD